MMELILWKKFEAGHRLIEGENRGTLCTQPHGHTWNVKAYFSPLKEKLLNQKENTIILFSKIKAKWHVWLDEAVDHSFIFNQQDPLLTFMREDLPFGRHVVVPGDPTTEMVAVVLKAKLETFLKGGNLPITCHKLILNETQTNGIICTDDPAIHLPQPDNGITPWWLRNDFSTNDFTKA